MRPNDFMAAFQTKVIPNLFSQLRHSLLLNVCLSAIMRLLAATVYMVHRGKDKGHIAFIGQKFTVLYVLNK